MASGLRPGAIDRGRLPVQTRDRRAALSALALLLVVAGALGSALVVYRSGHRTDVLVAAHDLKPGQIVQPGDLTVARAASDTGQLILASNKSRVVGSYVVTAVPIGTVLNPKMFLLSQIVPADGVIVGITLPANHRPALALHQGDLVRVYELPDSSGGSGNATSGVVTAPAGAAPAPTTSGTATTSAGNAKVLVDVARVVEAPGAPDNSGGLEVSLLLKATDAQAVIGDNAAGAVAVARLPVTSTPGIDLKTAAPPAPAAAPATKAAPTATPAG